MREKKIMGSLFAVNGVISTQQNYIIYQFHYTKKYNKKKFIHQVGSHDPTYAHFHPPLDQVLLGII